MVAAGTGTETSGQTMGGEQAELLQENARLKKELDELRRATPWWRRGLPVTTLVAVIGAVVPLTAGIQESIQKAREVALETAKQKVTLKMQQQRQTEDIRTAYLERMETPGEHLRTLRFVIATTQDQALRAWAVGEKKVVEEELHALDDQIRQDHHAAVSAERTYLTALRRYNYRRYVAELRRQAAERRDRVVADAASTEGVPQSIPTTTAMPLQQSGKNLSLEGLKQAADDAARTEAVTRRVKHLEKKKPTTHRPRNRHTPRQ